MTDQHFNKDDTYPGLFYAVLRSTVVVHGFFRRKNDGDAGSCDKS